MLGIGTHIGVSCLFSQAAKTHGQVVISVAMGVCQQLSEFIALGSPIAVANVFAIYSKVFGIYIPYIVILYLPYLAIYIP